MSLQYPLQLRFKVFALATQIYVEDASGRTVFYVKQKMFKLKEDIAVFRDEDQREQAYAIKADRMLDFSANYAFTDAAGRALGRVKREGARSLWSARYEIFDAHGGATMSLGEENPWIKVVDALVDEIPVVGMVASYFLNPSYVVTDHGQPVMRIVKRRSVLERRFEIQKLGELKEEDEIRAILGSLMMVLLERERG